MPAPALARLVHVQRSGGPAAGRPARGGRVSWPDTVAPPADGQLGTPQQPSVRPCARDPPAHTVTTILTTITAAGGGRRRHERGTGNEKTLVRARVAGLGGRRREHGHQASDQGAVIRFPRGPDFPPQGALLAVGIEQPGRAVEQRLRANKIRPLYRSQALDRCRSRRPTECAAQGGRCGAVGSIPGPIVGPRAGPVERRLRQFFRQLGRHQATQGGIGAGRLAHKSLI
jgi:hypothetical protein